MLGFYFLIGIVYVIINGIIRKLYVEEDFLLVMAHIFVWPMFLLLLVITKFPKLLTLKK